MHDYVRTLIGHFLRSRGELIEPLRPAVNHLRSGEAQVSAKLPPALLEEVLIEHDLDLLDVFTIQEQLDALEQHLAPINLDEWPARLGGHARWGGGQDHHAENRIGHVESPI